MSWPPKRAAGGQRHDVGLRQHRHARLAARIVTSSPEELVSVFNANPTRYLAGRPLHHVVDRRRSY